MSSGVVLTRPTLGDPFHPPIDCLAIVYAGRALFPGGDGETLLWLSPLGDVADVMKDLTWEQS
jgi:hypothetical protein